MGASLLGETRSPRGSRSRAPRPAPRLKLEAAGLARRERSASDRRQVLWRITPAGLACLKKLDGPMDAADAAALAMLTRKEQRRLVRLLDASQAGHQAREP